MPRDSTCSIPHPQPDQTSDPRRGRQSKSTTTEPTTTKSTPVPKVEDQSIPRASSTSSTSLTSNRHHPYASTSKSSSLKPETKPTPPPPYFTVHPEDKNLLWCKTCHDYRLRVEFNEIQLRLINDQGRPEKRRGGNHHPRCKRCVVTPIEQRQCSVCGIIKENNSFSEAQRKKSLDVTTCRTCVSQLENKNDKLKRSELQADPWRTTELDDLDSDPEDEVLESLEKPTVPINVEAYDREDSDDDE